MHLCVSDFINRTHPRNGRASNSNYTDGVFLYENASSPSVGSSVQTESDRYESDVDTDMDCDNVDSDADRDEEEMRSSEFEPVFTLRDPNSVPSPVRRPITSPQSPVFSLPPPTSRRKPVYPDCDLTSNFIDLRKPSKSICLDVYTPVRFI
jgi:hypothetical protein